MVSQKKSIDVPPFTYWLSGIVEKHANTLIHLSKIETSYYQEALEPIEIEQPIFICGLARAGTTILLELLSTHPDVATHQYRDFPMLYTPIWWNWFLDRMPKQPQAPVERAHKDGILVTPESPEALEEVLWMKFLPHAHNPEVSSVLDTEAENQPFEHFYKEHIRKILLVRRGHRYVSKGNYNFARIQYLLRLFPDARFLILVRDPKTHIASLMKQHHLLCREASRNERILIHMRRGGHFEFGLDRRPINPNNISLTHEILNLWLQGEEVKGWARYWAGLYEWMLETINRNEHLSRASLIVHYKELCDYPQETLTQVSQHCRLVFEKPHFDELVVRLRYPSYYRVNFSDDELAIIQEETQAVCQRLGIRAKT